MTNSTSDEREERLSPQQRIRWALELAQKICHASFCNTHPMGQAEVCKATEDAISLLDSEAAGDALTGFGQPEDEARRILTYANDWIGDANYRVLHTEIVKSMVGLYSELDRVTKERDELRVVVDIATDDDPGSALSKLHKAQHIAATSMRSLCVEKMESFRERIEYEPDEAMREAHFGQMVMEVESLTLDQVEQKQK